MCMYSFSISDMLDLIFILIKIYGLYHLTLTKYRPDMMEQELCNFQEKKPSTDGTFNIFFYKYLFNRFVDHCAY